jgi:glycosyltransferase involved in cell wall biosynthesis
VEPKNPEKFAKDLADAVNSIVNNPEKLKSMALKSRKRVEDNFSWTSIAAKTIDFYKSLKKK